MSWLGTLNLALSALAFAVLDLNNPDIGRLPVAFAAAIVALSRATVYGVSTATSWVLLLVPALYVVIAVSMDTARAQFLDVHLLRTLLLLATVGVKAAHVRQREREQLYRLATLMRWEKEERDADAILALMLPHSILATLKHGGRSDQRWANAFPDVSILFGARRREGEGEAPILPSSPFDRHAEVGALCEGRKASGQLRGLNP